MARNCTASFPDGKLFPPFPLHLRAESILVQAYHWRLPRSVVNGDNVEAAGTFPHPSFGEEPLRSAHHDVLFFPRNAQLWQCRHVISHRAGANFDKASVFPS